MSSFYLVVSEKQLEIILQYVYRSIIIVCYYKYLGGYAVITLSAVPKSRNVSAGTQVHFTCATEESEVKLAITTIPTVVGSAANQTDLPNGGNQFTLSFTAPSEHSSITITCVGFRGSDIIQSTAQLMIQGNIIYTCLHV